LRYGCRAEDLQDAVSPQEFVEMWAAVTIEDLLIRPDLAEAAEVDDKPTMTAEASEAKAKAQFG